MNKKNLILIMFLILTLNINTPLNFNKKNLINPNPMELKRKGCTEVLNYNNILS